MDRAWRVLLAFMNGQLLAKGTSNWSNFQGTDEELGPSRELFVLGTVPGKIAKVAREDLGGGRRNVGKVTFTRVMDAACRQRKHTWEARDASSAAGDATLL